MQKTFGAVVGMEEVVPVGADPVECAGCGAMTNHAAEIDGESYCEDCTVCCEECGCELYHGDASRNESGDILCESCYDEHYCECDHCGCEVCKDGDDSRCSENGDYYCEECYNDRFCMCEHCNCEVRTDRSYTSEDGEVYCRDCYSELYNRCDGCGCEISTDDTFCNDSGCYCESCYSDRAGGEEFDGLRFRPKQSTYATIGSTRKFGIELETSECEGYMELEGETAFGAKDDGSIDGKEFVSNVLYGDEGLNEVKGFCRRANRMGFDVDSKCGYHAHFDASELSVDQLKSVAYAYHKTCDVWKAFVNESRRNNSYCGELEYGRDELMAIADMSDWRKFTNRMNRYCWFNVNAYSKHKTFEVRLHSATLDGDKVCNWVIAHTRFIDWAKDKTFAEINAFVGYGAQSQFTALDAIWDNAELSDYYASRARKFGVNIGCPARSAAR